MALMTKRSSSELSDLTVLELVSLKEALEEKWGVSAAAAAVAVAAPAAGGGGAGRGGRRGEDVVRRLHHRAPAARRSRSSR